LLLHINNPTEHSHAQYQHLIITEPPMTSRLWLQ